MISLKLTKKELTKRNKPMSIEEHDKYPYGTVIRLNEDQVEKISSLKKINAGDMVEINALGLIKEVRIVDTDKAGKRKNVEIQITDLDIGEKSSAEAAFNEE